MRDPWLVYLLECRDGTLYAGVTRDLVRRVRAHDSGRGARYTRGRGPVRVVAVSPPLSRSQALRVEIWLKRQPRADKLDALRAIEAPARRVRRAVVATAPRPATRSA